MGRFHDGSAPFHESGQEPHATARRAEMLAIQFDAKKNAPTCPSRFQRRSRAAKGIKHDVARRAECLDQWPQNFHRLLGGMPPVAGIARSVDHIRQSMRRLRRPPLRQQESLLMLVAQEARR